MYIVVIKHFAVYHAAYNILFQNTGIQKINLCVLKKKINVGTVYLFIYFLILEIN